MSRDDISRSTSGQSGVAVGPPLWPQTSWCRIGRPRRSPTPGQRRRAESGWVRGGVAWRCSLGTRRREVPRAMAVPATNLAQGMNLEGVTSGGRVGVTRGEDAARVSLSSDERRVAAPGGNPLDPLELPARDNDGVIKVVDRGAQVTGKEPEQLPARG